MTRTNNTREKSFKDYIIGLLEHKNPDKQLFFTVMKEIETGANYVVEVLYKFPNSFSQIRVSPTMYIQVDKCPLENNNRYIFAYIKRFVARGVFRNVEVSFHPIGHTHDNIDQTFSKTSVRLRSVGAITLINLHAELRTAYAGNASVVNLKSFVN